MFIDIGLILMEGNPNYIVHVFTMISIIEEMGLFPFVRNKNVDIKWIVHHAFLG